MKKLQLIFFKTAFFIAVFQFVFSNQANAQLTTTRAGSYASINYLVNNVLLGNGVTATNITYQGIDTSFGFFLGKSSNIGMDSGLIITNGTITLADGPNQKTYGDQSDGKFTSYGYPNDGWPNSNTYNDSDLAKLINTTYKNTYSCAVLQFDFIATSDSVSFQYVFGSNEEPYYVGNKYLDDFGLFLSGPGIAGPFSHSAINLAVVPGTTTPVYIDSISCTINSAYYVCNWPNSKGCSSCPANINTTTVGYNGFTTVLTAKASVQCGKKYHIKIGIADIANGKFDSGVFLKGGSFKPGSGAMTVSPTSSTICLGSNTTLTASGASAYSWAPAASLNVTTGGSVIATPSVTTTYTVVGNITAGCNDTTQIVVTVNQTPTIMVTPTSATICPGGSTTLTASGATSYTWSPSTGLNASTGASVNASPGSTTTYTVTGISAGCSGSSSQNSVITVNPTPTITVSPATDSICNGGNVSLTANGGTSYTWSPISGLTCTTCATTTANPTVTTIYQVVGTSLGCSDSATTSITVINSTAAVITPVTDTICAGNSATLTVNGTGLSYLWSNNATTSIITVSPASNTYYYVIASNKCTRDSIGVTVYVAVPPVLFTTGNDSICPGDNDVIKVTGGTSYTWSPATGLNTTTGAVVQAVVNKTTVYTVTSNGKCPGTATFTVNVRIKPPIKITGDSVTCKGNSVILTAVGPGPYTWSNSETTQSITVNPTPPSSSYFVIVTNGCSDTAFHTVLVDSATQVHVCCDTTIQVGGTALVVASGASSYAWSPENTVNCNSCAATTVTPGTTTTYTVTGTDANGCTSNNTVIITIECNDFTVPNVFTPNNDGQNDTFLIKAFYESSYNIEIYNRWGILVYKSTDPNSPWTGKDENGQMVSDGVYYYIIKSKCGDTDFNHHGFVQVIK